MKFCFWMHTILFLPCYNGFVFENAPRCFAAVWFLAFEYIPCCFCRWCRSRNQSVVRRPGDRGFWRVTPADGHFWTPSWTPRGRSVCPRTQDRLGGRRTGHALYPPVINHTRHVMAGAFIIDFGNTNSKTKTITLIVTSDTDLCGNILDSLSLKVTDICTAHKMFLLGWGLLAVFKWFYKQHFFNIFCNIRSI